RVQSLAGEFVVYRIRSCRAARRKNHKQQILLCHLPADSQKARVPAFKWEFATCQAADGAIHDLTGKSFRRRAERGARGGQWFIASRRIIAAPADNLLGIHSQPIAKGRVDEDDFPLGIKGE